LFRLWDVRDKKVVSYCVFDAPLLGPGVTELPLVPACWPVATSPAALPSMVCFVWSTQVCGIQRFHSEQASLETLGKTFQHGMDSRLLTAMTVSECDGGLRRSA
jgi:hypothetical protein